MSLFQEIEEVIRLGQNLTKANIDANSCQTESDFDEADKAQEEYEDALQKLENHANKLEDELEELEAAKYHASAYVRLMSKGKMDMAHEQMKFLWKALVPELCK